MISNTTVSQTDVALSAFLLAMAMYPEAQRKAQKEVDSIIGSGRFPTIEDQEETIYIQALILELFRWHQVTPLGTQAFHHFVLH